MAHAAEAHSAMNSLETTPQHLIASILVPLIPDTQFSALIDCGCSHSFISSDIVSKFSLPHKSLQNHLKLTLFDGSLSNYITHSVKLLIKFLNGLNNCWTFFETTLSLNCHFTLGLNWLCTQNPQINWATGSVSLGSLEPVGTSSLAAYSEDMTVSLMLLPHSNTS
jgi:hypothetical protein